MEVPPEFSIKTGGKNGGFVDFLLPKMGWRLELIRERDRLKEHMGRFTNGLYSPLLESGTMGDYLVVGFTTIYPTRAHPGKINVLPILLLERVVN